MDEKLQEELLTRLDLLAAKLGVTSEHLWGVLIKQARIEVIESILTLIVVVMGILACAYFWRKIIEFSTFDGSDLRLGGSVGSIALNIFFSGLLLILSIGAFMDIMNIPTLLFNPEYWALQKVLGAL